jgi:hypothetical protein
MHKSRLIFTRDDDGAQAPGKAGIYMITKTEGRWPFATQFVPKGGALGELQGVDGEHFETEEEAVEWCEEYESQFH